MSNQGFSSGNSGADRKGIHEQAAPVSADAFCWSDFDPEKEKSPPGLPEGLYHVAIVSAESKQARGGGGEYLAVEFKVLTGAHENRRHFENYNRGNVSEDARRIARQQMADLCIALGIHPKSDADLKNAECGISVVYGRTKTGAIDPDRVYIQYMNAVQYAARLEKLSKKGK